MNALFFFVLLFFMQLLQGCTPPPEAKREVGPPPAARAVSAEELLPYVAKHFERLAHQHLDRGVDWPRLLLDVLGSEELHLRERDALKRAYTQKPTLRFVDQTDVTALGTTLLEVLGRTAAHGFPAERTRKYAIEPVLKKQKRWSRKYKALVLQPPAVEVLRGMYSSLRVEDRKGGLEPAAQAMVRLLFERIQPRAERASPMAQAMRWRKQWAFHAVRAELQLADLLLSMIRDFKQGDITADELRVFWHRTLKKRAAAATKAAESPDTSKKTSASSVRHAPPPARPVTPLPESLALLDRSSRHAYTLHLLVESLNGLQTPAHLLALEASLPPSHANYRLLQKLLVDLQRLRERGFNSPPGTLARTTMVPGMQNTQVRWVKELLAAFGYYQGPINQHADAALMAALRDFQNAQRSPVGAAVQQSAMRELAVPLDEQIAKVQVNLERWRRSALDPESFHVWVNIPQFVLELRHGEQVLAQMPVVVGKPQGQRCDERTRTMVPAFVTPLLAANVQKLIFSPHWNVTRTIKETELDPERAKDPLYFEKHGYEVSFPNTDREVVRELPSPSNSLGFVKFLFPNPYEIYLHDTPHKDHFTYRRRVASHGCVRVGNPWELARQLLLKDGQWDEERFTQLHAQWKSISFKPLRNHWDERLYRKLRERARALETHIYLNAPVPIHIEYFTLLADARGRFRFFSDIYGYDRNHFLNRQPVRCIAESTAAQTGFEDFMERLDLLNQEALALKDQIDRLLPSVQKLVVPDEEKNKRVNRSIRQLAAYHETYSTMALYIQEQYDLLKKRRRRVEKPWRDRDIHRAVRVERLFKALIAQNETAVRNIEFLRQMLTKQ